MNKRTPYIAYIVIGILYVAVKIGFVSVGYLHPGAITNGAIPAIITIVVGVLAFLEYKDDPGKKVWHKIALIAPVLIFIITPIFMYLKQGDQWLTEGRLPVLVIYGCFAVLQFIIILRIRSVQKHLPNYSRRVSLS